MFSLKPDPEIRVQTMQIASGGRKLSMLVLSPKTETIHAPGILWIHGGGYIYGMKETVRYIEALKACGIPADMDVYPTDTHAFDMMKPQESLSIKAAAHFNEVFAYAKENYFASQAQNR